jgi:hypothetical protein
MGTDGACGLLFCAAKRSGAFPPNMSRIDSNEYDAIIIKVEDEGRLL